MKIGRVDIPEGCDYRQMPMVGWGRILSVPAIKERYFTIGLWRLRLLRASGHYGAGLRCSRWHLFWPGVFALDLWPSGRRGLWVGGRNIFHDRY